MGSTCCSPMCPQNIRINTGSEGYEYKQETDERVCVRVYQTTRHGIYSVFRPTTEQIFCRLVDRTSIISRFFAKYLRNGHFQENNSCATELTIFIAQITYCTVHKGKTMDGSNINDYIRTKNYGEVGNLFVRALPDGSAVEFLENVLSTLPRNGGLVHKKARISTGGGSSASTGSAEALNANLEAESSKFVLDDTVDDMSITLALQIPEDMNLMAYIIGPKGINVINIGKLSGTKIQLEKVGARGTDQFRHIFMMGPLKCVLRAYQLLQDHINQKNEALPTGSTDVTRMVIPNDVVAHVIGRGGSLIKELSSIASIQRIDIQQESEMNRMTNGYYGRSVTILGDFSHRLHAVYLLLRQLVQDKSLPAIWIGESLPVQFPPNQGLYPNSQQSFNLNGMGMGIGGMVANSQMGFSDGLGGRSAGLNGIFPRGPSGPPPNMNHPTYENTMKVDIQVPSDKACLGHIIGPKGIYIDEMQRNSHCQIKIDKEHKEGTNILERNVAVSGSNMVQICLAIELINTKVEEWRRNFNNNGGSNINSNSNTSYKAPDVPKPYWEETPSNNGTSLGGYTNAPPTGYAPQYPKSQPPYVPTGLGMSPNTGMQGQNLGQGQAYNLNQGYNQGQGRY